MDEYITPPFIFRVKYQTRVPHLKFTFDVVAINSAEAVKITEPFLVNALKAGIQSGEIAIGDARPLFYEITMLREVKTGKEYNEVW